METPDSVCVFCGSSAGVDPVHAAAARDLGAALAARGIRLVYGGGNVGLMGILADAALAGGGRVLGVIPGFMRDRELGHRGLTELRVVADMHARKAAMAEAADAFLALPGGIGTLDEMFEIWTWAQVGLHAKPCALVNVKGYYDGLIAFLDHMVGAGFLRAGHRATLGIAPDARSALDLLPALPPPGGLRDKLNRH